MEIKISNVNIKDNEMFLKFAKIYFIGLNKNFISTNYWKKNYLKNLLIDKDIQVKWIKNKNSKVGFFIIKKFKNNYTKKINLIIKDFFILKKFRLKKIGSFVVNYIIKYCKNKKIKVIEIEIIKKNKKVIKFWKNFKLKLKSTKFSIGT